MGDVQPPAGYGNPLGIAGAAPRLGPCMAGRTVKRDDWPWDRPCGSAAEVVLVVRETDPPEQDDEALLIPMCSWHRDLMDAGGVDSSSEPPDEPS